jgi:methylated-DNA-[protein]-cysteine S-methyltransferase
MTRFTLFDSPLGPLRIASNGRAITAIGFPGQKHNIEAQPDWQRDDAASELAAARRQLAEYFAGQRREFDLPLQPAGSPFQQSVWRALARVGYGRTSTYGALARALRRPAAARAVGAAVGRNPIAIVVPCHRIVGADGSLTGYAGGLDRKTRLLALEGALHA